MRAITALAAAALTLAACQSPEEKHAAATGEIDVTNKSTAEMRKLIAAAAPKTAAKAGMWRGELRLLDIDLSADAPGGRDAYLQSMKRLERSTLACRKAEDIKPFDIAALEKAAGGCTFLRFTAKGGRVDAQIQCKKDGAPLTKVTLQGTTSPTGFDVTTSQQTGAKGEAGYVAVKMRATGTRTGDCSA
jgi:hypothetical protein